MARSGIVGHHQFGKGVQCRQLGKGGGPGKVDTASAPDTIAHRLGLLPLRGRAGEQYQQVFVLGQNPPRQFLVTIGHPPPLWQQFTGIGIEQYQPVVRPVIPWRTRLDDRARRFQIRLGNLHDRQDDLAVLDPLPDEGDTQDRYAARPQGFDRQEAVIDGAEARAGDQHDRLVPAGEDIGEQHGSRDRDEHAARTFHDERIVATEFEAGLEMTRQVLLDLGIPVTEIQRHTEMLRQEYFTGRLSRTRPYQTLSQFRAAEQQFDLQWVPLGDCCLLRGHSIGENEIRKRTGVSVVGILRDDKLESNPGPDFCFQDKDLVAIIGSASARERFTALFFQTPEPVDPPAAA